MDLDAPDMATYNVPPAVVPALFPPRIPDSSSTHVPIVASATPDKLTRNPADLSHDVASGVNAMTKSILMGASPVVKLMSEIEKPNQEQLKAYDYAITAMKERVKDGMLLQEKTIQHYRETERELAESRLKVAGELVESKLQVARDLAESKLEVAREFAESEANNIAKLHEYQYAALAEISEMTESMAFAMLKAATTLKGDAVDSRRANLLSPAPNFIFSTPDTKTRPRNNWDDGHHEAVSQATATHPPVSTVLFSTGPTFNLPASGGFCIGVGTDKKPPAKYRVKPKTRTPIRSCSTPSKSAKSRK